MLFITSQTCQTTFPSPNVSLEFCPHWEAGCCLGFFGCSDLCLDSLELLWNLGNAVWPLNASCGVSWCFCMSVPVKSMNQKHSAWGLSDRGSFIVRSTDHTHMLSSYRPRWRRPCCVQGRVGDFHTHWFSCLCLTLLKVESNKHLFHAVLGFYSGMTHFLFTQP